MDKKRFKRSQFAIVLVLAPLNNTFERKCLIVPFAPDALKLGRQTTARTAAATDNGFFDSRVLSRQHAEIWAERETGQVWLRDCKSSNGTYINKQRLSPENTESEPFELKRNDELDLGIDIVSNDDSKQMYRRISARVEKISMLLLQMDTAKGSAKNGGIVGAASGGFAVNGMPGNDGSGLRHSGSVNNGSVNSGLMSSGSVNGGLMSSGSVNNGLMNSGSVNNGSFNSGSLNGSVNGAVNGSINGAINSASLNGGIKHLQMPALSNASATNGLSSASSTPSVSRKPSLETLKNVNTHVSGLDGRNSEAIFGTPASLETLALNYATTTAGGMLVKDSVKNHVEFELAAKRLVAQIRSVRADTAKLESLAALLAEIKEVALETETRDRLDRENLDKERQQLEAERTRQAELLDKERATKMKSSSIAALKAENARFRAERASYTKQQRNRSRGLSFQGPQSNGFPNGIAANGATNGSSSNVSPSGSPNGSSNSPNGLLNGSNNSLSGPLNGSAHESPTNTAAGPTPGLLNDSNATYPISHSHSHAHSLEKRHHLRPNAQHNSIVLFGTAVLVTLVGVVIMFFFNPPMAPSSHTPPFFDLIFPQR